MNNILIHQVMLDIPLQVHSHTLAESETSEWEISTLETEF